MKVISIVNRKGGVGKTTVALNLAYELSRIGFKVLAIDLDDQCDLTKILLQGVEDKDIKDVMENQISLDDVTYETYKGLYGILGSRDIVHIESHDSYGLKKELSNHQDNYDFVIIDHPPNINEASLQGLLASDEVLIVTDVEAFGMENLSNLLEDLIAIKDDMNNDLRITGVVANKVDLRRNLSKKKLTELQQSLGKDVFKTYISNDTAVPTAHNEQVPVRKIGWRSRVVGQISTITEELLERVGDVS